MGAVVPGRSPCTVSSLRHSSFQSLPANGLPQVYGLPVLRSICMRPFHQPPDAMPVVAERQRLLSMDTHWVLAASQVGGTRLPVFSMRQ
jgi:hypothetical protein